MDLTVSREQYDAVREARHLPDVLRKVLDGAARARDGYVLHLTYEEATALNELCAWNVHTDASGAARLAGVRRAGAGDPDPPGLLTDSRTVGLSDGKAT